MIAFTECKHCKILLLFKTAAVKFVNSLEFSILLHKYDPKRNQNLQVLKVDKENPIIFLVIYLFRKNDTLLHICELQKCVNLLDQQLIKRWN